MKSEVHIGICVHSETPCDSLPKVQQKVVLNEGWSHEGYIKHHFAAVFAECRVLQGYFGKQGCETNYSDHSDAHTLTPRYGQCLSGPGQMLPVVCPSLAVATECVFFFISRVIE